MKLAHMIFSSGIAGKFLNLDQLSSICAESYTLKFPFGPQTKICYKPI